MKFKWEEPTRTERGPGKWQRMADQLAHHPGRWALVEDASVAGAVALRKYGAEVKMRGINGSRVEKLYARWPEQ